MKKIVNKLKQNAKAIAAFVLGIVLAGGTVYAATVLPSSQVGYDNSASGLAATDVQGALDELYEKSERNCKSGFVYVITANGYSCNHYNNYITLTITGAGNKRVFSSDFDPSNNPNMVIINGNLMGTITYTYNFTDQNNTVTLVWNDAIDSTYSMFKYCTDIASLDFSHFDTSQVVNMKEMFNGASSLTSLDLSNFDTSIVTDMSGMFADASSLTSLDLSNWDTSKVERMNYMFYNASSLTSLDLSNWDTSNVQYMNNMFSGANPNLQVCIDEQKNLALVDQIHILSGASFTCAN